MADPHPPADGVLKLNPALIHQAMNAFQRAMALKGALDLELFTHIDDGAITVAELALRCDASERGIRILCDFLTLGGYLTKQDASYGLTPDSSAFLSKRSAAYLGSAADFLLG